VTKRVIATTMFRFCWLNKVFFEMHSVLMKQT